MGHAGARCGTLGHAGARCSTQGTAGAPRCQHCLRGFSGLLRQSWDPGIMTSLFVPVRVNDVDLRDAAAADCGDGRRGCAAPGAAGRRGVRCTRQQKRASVGASPSYEGQDTRFLILEMDSIHKYNLYLRKSANTHCYRWVCERENRARKGRASGHPLPTGTAHGGRFPRAAGCGCRRGISHQM